MFFRENGKIYRSKLNINGSRILKSGNELELENNLDRVPSIKRKVDQDLYDSFQIMRDYPLNFTLNFGSPKEQVYSYVIIQYPSLPPIYINNLLDRLTIWIRMNRWILES